MDKTLVGLIGAVSAFAAPHAPALAASQAAIPPARSYADLLRPIPNATAVLAAIDASAAIAPPARIEEVQYYPRHHHHHHRRYVRRHHHHHHHSVAGVIARAIQQGR